MNARPFYLVMVALLYAILFTQTAHAAKLPRRASAGELPQPVKLLVTQRVQDENPAVVLSALAPNDGSDVYLIFAGVMLSFGLRGLSLAVFEAIQHNLRAVQERLSLTAPLDLTPLRI